MTRVARSRQRPRLTLSTVLALLALVAVLAAACSAGSRSAGSAAPGKLAATGDANAPERAAGAQAEPQGGAPGIAAPQNRAPGSAPADNAGGAAPQQASQPLPALPSVDRMIVKTATLTLEVTDLVEAVQRVGGVVAGIPGAYVAASTTNYRADPAAAAESARAAAGEAVIAPPRPVPPTPAPGQSATVTIKVPADAFGEALQRLRPLGTPLLENVSTQEVTEEFVDLEAQARNLEATEQQYLRFLERAQRIEEILPLQQRITEVRSQIERLRGRMNLLQRRADTSTISVTLVLPAKLGDPRLGPEPRPIRTLRAAWSHLATALQWLLDAAIYVGVYALPLLPLAAAYWWWRSRRPAPSAGGAV
jgi:hypothetical protein